MSSAPQASTRISRIARCPACGRREKRSSEQNRRYWALVAALSEQKRPNGAAYGVEAWHTWLKAKFLGCEDIRLPNGATMTIPLSSADLEPDAFSDYMTQVEAWANERGVYLDD